MILTIFIVCLFSQYSDPPEVPIPPNWKLEGIVDQPAPIAMAYSADGNSLAILYPLRLEVWKRGGTTPAWKIEPLNRATSLAWAPDGKQIAITEKHQTGIWTAGQTSSAPLRVLKNAAVLRDSYDLRWEADEFLSCRNGTWSAVSGEPSHVTRVYSPHTWKPDGSSFAWVEQKQLMVAAREAPNATPVQIPIPFVNRVPMGRFGGSDAVQGCRFAPKGDLVLCFTSHHGSIIDTQRKTIVSEFTTQMAMSRGGWVDSDNLWVLTNGSHLRYYDAKSGRLTRVIESPDRFAIAAAGRPAGAAWIPPVKLPVYAQIIPIALAPDHRSLLVEIDNKVECRRLDFSESGNSILWTLPAGTSPFHDLDTKVDWFWSPDSSKLARVGGGRLMILDAASGREIHRFAAHVSTSRKGAWSPDSKKFALLDSADSALTFGVGAPFEIDWMPVVPAANGLSAKLEWTSELAMREPNASGLITTPDNAWALQSNATRTTVRLLSRSR